MELRKFNNKIVTITDVDNQTFEGIVFLKIRVLLMKSIMLYLLKQVYDGWDCLKMKFLKLKLLIKSASQKALRFISKGFYSTSSFNRDMSIMLLLDNYEQNLVRFHFWDDHTLFYQYPVIYRVLLKYTFVFGKQ